MTSHIFEYTGSSLYFAWKSGKNTNKKKWTVHGEHVSVIICKEDEWKRDSNGLIQHFGSLALWWQGNSIGWSTYLWCTSINNLYTCKWHATHCCKACVLWFDSYGSQTFYICCSLLNFDLSICLLILFICFLSILKLSRYCQQIGISLFFLPWAIQASFILNHSSHLTRHSFNRLDIGVSYSKIGGGVIDTTSQKSTKNVVRSHCSLPFLSSFDAHATWGLQVTFTVTFAWSPILRFFPNNF